MTFHGIAYGPDEHVLLTFDGADVLAHDAQTEAPKWSLSLAHPVVALFFIEPGALPGCEGANPWRSSSTGRAVVAVDDEGSLHVIEPTLGKEIGTLGPFGKAVAVASGVGGRVALATADRVHVWRAGEKVELPARASALAFSNDAITLAIGERDGTLRFLSVAPSAAPVETFCAVVHGGVTDLVQHPGGTWIVAGKSGISTVTDAGPRRLDNLPASILRVRLDANGQRLAAQLSDNTVAVYAWPSLEVELRVEYVERKITGVSFGPANWLGLALDHGDGNKIDIVTSATHRTDTHPGRTHRSWLLSVRGKQTVLSAKEAEEIRRMKAPFHNPEPVRGQGNNGARVGIGVAISVALLCLRLCAMGSRHSSYPSTSYTPSTFDPSLYAPTAPECDRACATQRLSFLRSHCASDARCSEQASEAVLAFAANDCRRTKSALGRITSTSSTAAPDVILDATLSLAQKGVESACASSLGSTTASKHPVLVRLRGPKLETTTESIPLQNSGESEEPAVMWAAPDGTVFVSTVNPTHDRSVVHQRDSKTGLWSIIARRRTTIPAQLWGRSATDLYIMDVDSLVHYDGNKTTEIAPPVKRLFSLGGVGDEVFVVGEPVNRTGEDDGVLTQIHRHRGLTGPWTSERPDRLDVKELWSGGGGGALWGRALPPDGTDGTDDRLLLRGAGGKWTEKPWFGQARPGTVAIETVWVSPTNDAFVATGAGIFRSAGGGATWTKIGEPAGVAALWGRSSRDVFVATSNGVLHYDGKGWNSTSYSEPAAIIGGTATDVLIAVTANSSD